MHPQHIYPEQLRCSSPSGQQYYSSVRLWTSACTVLCLEHTPYLPWQLSCLHLRPAFWEERAVWEALVSFGAQLQGVSAEAPLHAPSQGSCLAVVLTPIFFSLVGKEQPLLLQGHIAPCGQESQSIMSMSWDQLKNNSVLGCCTEFPSKWHRHCAIGSVECCTGIYIALTDYG